ncbi:MAG: hypothetical protein JWO38_5873 [Gemmataceae bacterium]|nr:hypothetical protein [Gemmataceae bacterium]
MSRMLTLIHGGWTATRSLARNGRRVEALAQATQILSRPDLPVAVAADARRLAAELLIESERYVEARRHLRAAAALEPAHARTYYLAGLASERDPDGDDRRAAVNFRRASGAEPENALYRAAFGRAAVRCDRVKKGVRELLAAAAAAGDKIPVLRVVVDGLIEAGRARTARRVLQKARFLCPRSSEVRRLWERVRFETARAGQQNARRTQDARFAMDGDIVLLPFLRVVGSDDGQSPSAGHVRRDVGSTPRPHLGRPWSTKADR